jgi:hypothetical protein
MWISKSELMDSDPEKNVLLNLVICPVIVVGGQGWITLFPSVGRPSNNWVDIYIVALGSGNVFYFNRNT